jgi:hypothetical protein
MRFDEYLQQHRLVAVPVDRFDGLEVSVEGPHDWEAVEDRPGMRIWAWREDPFLKQFCANAVLTMHRVPAELDPAEVFAMLSDEQVHLVPGCHERQRTSDPADDGAGLWGLLSSQFDSEFGTIDSISRTRIITGPEETLIAQLTLTALHDSPVNWDNIHLRVDAVAAPSEAASGGGPGGPTVTETRGDA